jgi:hypothetical protein
MPKKQKSNWMEDGDDAHFSDNPAVDEKTRKKWRAEEKNLVVSSVKGHPSAKARPKKKGSAKKYVVKK